MITRLWKTLLTVGAALSLILFVGATPAYAGDAGRVCKTYYHLNNPALGGYTVCIKLEHDPTQHAWRTVVTVSTTTPGMTLHTGFVQIYFDGLRGPSALTDGPAATVIRGASPWLFCHGQHNFLGFEQGYVTWPDHTQDPDHPVETDTQGVLDASC